VEETWPLVEEERSLIRLPQTSQVGETRTARHRRKACGRSKETTSRAAAHRNTDNLQTTSILRLQPRT
jgi:hypothetical protein